MIGWFVEQVSLMRPRINRAACKDCRLCVRACPTQAMSDYYDGKVLHVDCFACGACIEACPQGENEVECRSVDEKTRKKRVDLVWLICFPPTEHHQANIKHWG